MMKVHMNGRDMSDGELNILVTRDAATGEEEVRLYSGFEEIVMNSMHDQISVSIDVTSDDDLPQMYENSKTVDNSMNLIKQALIVVRNELDWIGSRYDDLYEQYLQMCNCVMKGDSHGGSGKANL